jgi:hypothetical protein
MDCFIGGRDIDIYGSEQFRRAKKTLPPCALTKVLVTALNKAAVPPFPDTFPRCQTIADHHPGIKKGPTKSPPTSPRPGPKMHTYPITS